MRGNRVPWELRRNRRSGHDRSSRRGSAGRGRGSRPAGGVAGSGSGGRLSFLPRWPRLTTGLVTVCRRHWSPDLLACPLFAAQQELLGLAFESERLLSCGAGNHNPPLPGCPGHLPLIVSKGPRVSVSFPSPPLSDKSVLIFGFETIVCIQSPLFFLTTRGRIE